MKVLVTGGGGFIASNLVRALIKKNYDVGMLLKDSGKYEGESWRIKSLLDKVTPLHADLTDKEELAKAIKEYKPEIIYHLATYGVHMKTQNDLELMLKTNVHGSVNLAEAADAAGGIPIINTGTTSEYGIKNAAMKETDICQPNNPYGWSKLTQTQFFQLKGAPTLRLFNVYGQWEEPTRLIPTLIKAKMKNLPVKLVNSVRDFIYVDDVTDAFIQAGEKYENIRGEIINVGTGQQTSIKEVMGMLDKINPLELVASWDYKSTQTETENWRADINKAENALGWKPKYSMEQGLKKTYDWWREYLDLG